MASPSSRADLLPSSPFTALADLISARRAAGDEIIPLHIGDTYLDPPVNGVVGCGEGHNRYTAATGEPSLVSALEAREGRAVLPTAGATGGVALAVRIVAEPGDRILVMAPYWPLVRGICQAAQVTPLEMPCYGLYGPAVLASIEAVLKTDPGIKAVYVSSPSNPTGLVLPPSFLDGLAGICTKYDRWIISDETYAEYVYKGRHFSPRLKHRDTITVNSFSKMYGLAGHRVGWITGPKAALKAALKFSANLWYTPPTVGQRVCAQALENTSWIPKARAQYRRTGIEAAKIVGAAEPEGSQFLWVDLKTGADSKVRQLLQEGVLVTPGAAFGEGFEQYIRVCYTSAPPDVVLGAIRTIASVAQET